jgi:hypothetical protein
MASEAARLFATVGAETTEYERKMRQARQTFDKTTRDMKRQADDMARAISGGLGGIAGMLGVSGIAMLGKQVYDMNALGASAERTEEAFRRLAGTEADKMLTQLSQLSRGTIAEMDLMAASSRALRLHVADNAEDMGKLMQVAQLRGREMGLSTAQAFDNIVTGIGRMSPLILDNLGIIIDLDAAYDNYARTLGKTADALTEVEQKAAVREAIFAETPEAFAGIIAPDAMESFESVQAALTDIRVEMGKIMSLEFSGDLATVADALGSFGDTIEGVRGFRTSVEELIAPVTDFIDRIDTGNQVLDSFIQHLLRLDMKGFYKDVIMGGVQEMPTVIDLATGAVDSLTPAVDEANTVLVEQAAVAREATIELLSLKDAWAMVNNIMPFSFGEARDIAKARFEYEFAKADTQGRIRMLVEKIGKAQVGTVEWYNLNKQLVGLEQRYRSELESTNKSLRSRQDIMARQSEAQFRSLVEGVLQPTQVTDLDMARTRLGTYTDQWDEYIRRIRSAATDADSVWRHLVPTDILAQGGDALKVWAAETEEAFYAGQMPEMVNWDAVMANIEKQVRYQAGREALVNEAIRRAQAAGLAVNVGQIREALGVGQTYTEIGQDVAAGMQTGMSGVNIAEQVTTSFEADLKKQQERYVAQGQLMVSWLATGVKDGTPALAGDLALALFPALQRLFANAGPRP